MKFNVLNKYEVKLQDHKEYQNRILELTEKILENDDFKPKNFNESVNLVEILNISYPHDKEVAKDIENRWLGVKKVGDPNLKEPIKNLICGFGTYLLSCKEYSRDIPVREYNALWRRVNFGKVIDADDARKLAKASENIIFHKHYPFDGERESVVFYHNVGYEDFLEQRFDELSKIDGGNKEIYDVMAAIGYKINKCKSLRKECLVIKSEIEECERNIEQCRHNMKKLYEYYIESEKKNTSYISEIVRFNGEIRKLEKQIDYYVECIRDLNDDYITLTEYLFSDR